MLCREHRVFLGNHLGKSVVQTITIAAATATSGNVCVDSSEFEDQRWDPYNDICAVKTFQRTNNAVKKDNDKFLGYDQKTSTRFDRNFSISDFLKINVGTEVGLPLVSSPLLFWLGRLSSSSRKADSSFSLVRGTGSFLWRWHRLNGFGSPAPIVFESPVVCLLYCASSLPRSGLLLYPLAFCCSCYSHLPNVFANTDVLVEDVCKGGMKPRTQSNTALPNPNTVNPYGCGINVAIRNPRARHYYAAFCLPF